jgi:hypothetical protein
MSTLVIHAPHSQVQQSQKQSFTQTVATGRGDGYAISSRLFQQLSPGDDVVVMCKVHQRQAAGKIKELIPTEKTGTGMQRYDVNMTNLREVPFTHKHTRLNRNGVAVI